MAAETKEMSLKLVVDGRSKKVIYAEAKKDFVDFLFGIPQIPIGLITTLLEENGLQGPGSIGRVLQSVSYMEASHFHSHILKDMLVKPKVFSQKAQSPINPCLLLQEYASNGQAPTICRACGHVFRPLPTNVEGYLKVDNCAYMVMDDLSVSPMSTTSVFALLNKFKIKDLGSLEERTVKIDLKKGLALYKASMESDTVLTDVFSSRSQAIKMEPLLL